MLRRIFLSTMLAIGLTTAGMPSARAAEIDPLLPDKTTSVIYFNVKQILESDLIKKYALGQIKQMLSTNEDAQKMLKDLGIDPLKDIDRVMVGTWGKDAEDMEGLGVIRGRFDLEKLFAAAEKEAKNNGDKLSIVKEGDFKLVKFTPDNSPKAVYASLADEKTLIAGTDRKLVAEKLKTAKEGKKPTVNKELARLLLKMDDKASMFVTGVAQDGQKIELPPNVNIPGVDSEKLAKQLEKVTTSSMVLRLTDEVAFDIVMGMKDAEAADDFGETISQLIGTVKGFLPLISGQQPQMKPIADEIGKTLKSKVSDKDVTLTIKLSAEAIGKATGAGD
ncbi:MAG: hypothetical protein ACRC8S_21725 [Fimbriiglobus sp.]